jgi:hypothetical protein
MSYAFSVSRRGLRTAAALGAATLGLLVTTACEKPTPLMTVTVGSDTVTTEAACYAENGEALSREEGFGCLKQKTDRTITVGQGDRVHLGVEPEMADAGWVFFVDQRPMSAEELGSTYQTYEVDQWFQPQPGQGSVPDEVTLSVATLGEDELEGVWNIKVEREK